jgi:hypothetical protein
VEICNRNELTYKSLGFLRTANQVIVIDAYPPGRWPIDKTLGEDAGQLNRVVR